MVVVFALAAAVLYGSADFLGGAASRRIRALSVLTVSAPAGVVVLLAAALLAGGSPALAGVPWAVAGGAAGGAGLIVFYAGLAAGPMRVVAPVSAVVSTVLPVGVAVATGERPGPAVYAGGVICVLATVLVSMEGGGAGETSRHPPVSRGLAYGIGAGIAFGLFFTFLRVAATSGVLWPSALSRAAGAVIALAMAVWAGAPPAWRGASPRVLAAVVGSGLLDATANVCYVLATRAGLFGIAVVLTSLYPGVTVLLARVALDERLRPVQLAGLMLAIAGIAVVSL
ncbi:MAG: EamA family transporter [Streptosporangiaceae bacterium]